MWLILDGCLAKLMFTHWHYLNVSLYMVELELCNWMSVKCEVTVLYVPLIVTCYLVLRFADRPTITVHQHSSSDLTGCVVE